MLPKLTPEAQAWVDATLASMSLEERVGHLPNMYLTYSPTEVSQAAAVKVWLGELAPQGVCPVQQPVR